MEEREHSAQVSRRRFLEKMAIAGTLGGAGLALSGAILPPAYGPAATDVQESNYIIYIDAGTVKARNGTTGAIDYSGTNASTVIQSAINALTTGGLVHLKPGIYIIQNSLVPATNIRISGSGAATVLQAKNALNADIIAKTSGTISDFVLEDLKVDGNRANQTAEGFSVVLINATRCIIRQCTFVNCGPVVLKGDPISGQTSTRCHILDNSCESMGGLGLQFGASDCVIRGNVLNHPMVLSGSAHGINVSGGGGQARRVVVEGNWVFDPTGIGISVDGDSEMVTVVSNVVENTSGSAGDAINLEGWGAPVNKSPQRCVIASNTVLNGRIFAGGASTTNRAYRNIITGNHIDVGNRAIAGVLLNNSNQSEVSSNVITNSGFAGVEVTESHDCIISSNICRNNDQGNSGWPGIAVTGSSSGIIILGNRCFDDQLPKTQDNGIKLFNTCSQITISHNDVRGNLFTSGIVWEPTTGPGIYIKDNLQDTGFA